MEFRHTTDIEEVARYLAKEVAMQLRMGMRVLWFVPGGSGIAVAVLAARELVAANIPLERLTVTLTDERYGPVGHEDSNFAALMEAGFSVPGATLLPVLTGAVREETAHAWETALAEALAVADYCIGLFGIGADGHTAGILPGSVAATSEALVAVYHSRPFERITMTSAAIARLNGAIVYAAGQEKQAALTTLKAVVLPVTEQPAQALKQVPHAVLFSDQQ